MSKTNNLIAGLIKSGYVEQPGRSRKYRTFFKEGVRFPYLFVGKSGALRACETASSSCSMALTERSKEVFIAKGKAE